MGKKIAIILVLLIILGVGFYVIEMKKNTSSEVNVPVEEKKTEEIIQETATTTPFDNDKDGDTILDEKEKELGTSDFDYDTDGDGLSDVSEIDQWKTDPKNVDSDGDNFPDGYEVLNGYNPAGPGKLQ
ncbi:MAG: hypothetical protein V1848_03540 [Candidatus Magasanikbacteria bacterium]